MKSQFYFTILSWLTFSLKKICNFDKLHFYFLTSIFFSFLSYIFIFFQIFLTTDSLFLVPFLFFFLISFVKLIFHSYFAFFRYFRSGIYSCRNTEKYANSELRTLQEIKNYWYTFLTSIRFNCRSRDCIDSGIMNSNDK